MGRVIPSEVVRFIDESFGTWSNADEEPTVVVGIKQIGRLTAVATLIEMIPDELLNLPPAEYTELIAQTATLRANTRTAEQQGATYSFKGKHVWRIRRLLAQCPDEAAGAETTALSFIADVERREDLRRDIGEANAALSAGRWKSATVLAGAAIEGLLVWKLESLPSSSLQEALQAAKVSDLDKPPNEWMFSRLLKVCAALPNSLSADTVKQVELAQNYRNLIHPGRAQRIGERCGKDTALGALAGLERIIREIS